MVGWSNLLEASSKNTHNPNKMDICLNKLLELPIEWRLYNRLDANLLPQNLARQPYCAFSCLTMICYENVAFQRSDFCPLKFGKTDEDVICRKDLFEPYNKDRKSSLTTNYRAVCRKELEDWEARNSKLVFQIEYETVDEDHEEESRDETINTSHVQKNGFGKTKQEK